MKIMDLFYSFNSMTIGKQFLQLKINVCVYVYFFNMTYNRFFLVIKIDALNRFKISNKS